MRWIDSQAAIQASKEGFREVLLKHFEWAKDRIVMGSERKSAYIDEKNKLMTAYHEVCDSLLVVLVEEMTEIAPELGWTCTGGFVYRRSNATP